MDPNVSTLEQVFASLPGADDPGDAYASAAAVAEATGLSKSTVNERLRDLRQAGRVVSTDDATPLYRQTSSEDGVAAEEANAAQEAAEATQDGGEWPPASEPPAEDPESTTVTGGAPPEAPKKRAKKTAAKKAAPKKAAGDKTKKTPKKAAPKAAEKTSDVGTRKHGPGLQDAVLSHVQTDPGKAWGIYEIAKALHAYPTSVGYALKRLSVKGNVRLVQDTPPRYQAV